MADNKVEISASIMCIDWLHAARQLEILEKHIDEQFDIEKVVFLYTSGDIERDPFNFSQKTLNCLDNYEVCEGNENYYGFPLEETSPLVFLKKLKNYNLKKTNTIYIENAYWIQFGNGRHDFWNVMLPEPKVGINK